MIQYEYDLKSQILTKLIESSLEPAPFGKRFDPSDFVLKQVQVPAKDGTKVPMTLVHRKDLDLNGQNPTIIKVYGAYGHNLETGFELEDALYLMRDWVIALAHVRGGGELGLGWYESGRQQNKKNSFTDFVSCAKWLITNKYTKPEVLVAYGASAGGLPVAVAINENPGLFKAVCLKMPFIDVVNSMRNEDLPLTLHEAEEWGDIKNSDAFASIYNWDPYHNIRQQSYPAMNITSAFHDLRVPVWNQLRYVSRLRASKTNDEEILLRVDTTFGHFGDTSRDGKIQEAAHDMAFLFSSLDIIPGKL